MPDIEDKDDSQLIAVIPGLVLDGVVEDQGLAGDPFARLVAHAKAATPGHDKRQVRDEADVGDARMRRYARTGLQ